MLAASRLLVHDALAQVRARCMQHSQGLAGDQVTVAYPEAAGGSRGGSRATDVKGVPRGAAGQLMLTTDLVHRDMMALAAVAGGGSRKANTAVTHGAPVLALAGPGSSVQDGLTAAGLNPSPPARGGRGSAAPVW
jgi:hypothetical protein